MTSFSNLPLLIVSNIIEYVVRDRRWCSRTDKSVFTYLGICSHWRKIVASKYYSLAYYHDYADEFPDQTDTNIDLISSLSNVKYVDKVIIEIYTIRQLVRFLTKHRSLFKPGDNDWSNVNSFSISFYSVFSIPRSFELDGHSFDVHDGFIGFSQFVTEHMPALKSINLMYLDISDTATMATSMLLNAYSNQLNAIAGNFISCFDQDLAFDNLAKIELILNPDVAKMLPRLNYARITSMVLENIPYTFKLNDLFTDEGATMFTFSSMINITLAFSTDYTEDELNEYIMFNEIKNKNYKLRVAFPKLRSIHVAHKPSWFISKTTFIFPDDPYSLRMIQADGFCDILQKMNVKKLGISEIVVCEKESLLGPRFYQNTNKLFGPDKLSNYKSLLNIKFDYCLIDWSLTNWCNLTRIKLFDCKINDFVSLHKYCPGLKSLKMLKLIIEMTLDDVHCLFKSKLSLENNASTMNFAKIEHLRIRGFESKVVGRSEMASFVKFYISWAKSLLYVKLDNCQWMNLDIFTSYVENYCNHLRNVFVKY